MAKVIQYIAGYSHVNNIESVAEEKFMGSNMNDVETLPGSECV